MAHLPVRDRNELGRQQSIGAARDRTGQQGLGEAIERWIVADEGHAPVCARDGQRLQGRNLHLVSGSAPRGDKPRRRHPRRNESLSSQPRSSWGSIEAMSVCGWHWPALHAPPPQLWPQRPQFVLDERVSTHVPSHATCASGQVASLTAKPLHPSEAPSGARASLRRVRVEPTVFVARHASAVAGAHAGVGRAVVVVRQVQELPASSEPRERREAADRKERE